ncbi:MAG TPA: histidine kinase [Anaerolineales bacterium]|nr:histidine kinase [Anaerolineales bacterium]
MDLTADTRPRGKDELAVLADRLQGSLDPHAVLPAVATVVARALPARYAAVYLKRPDAEEFILAAEHGAADGQFTLPPSPEDVDATSEDLGPRGPSLSLTYPLLYRMETVGLLVVLPDGDHRPTPQKRRLLASIARGAGSAAQVVRQEHDLLRARERLVLAREEERRRLRRNLHDTIGPTLAALSLKAGSVRNLIEQDLPAAQDQLNELRELIHVVITDIRRVVYNLRPPALDELGMLPAIQESARQSSTGGLQVSVHAPDQMPPLSAAVEVAAYRIVMEALTNVERHAAARHCSIRLSVDDQVRIEVVDDGIGLPPNHRAGVGIASMRERIAELGGSFTIESPAGNGTRVLAILPATTQAPGWEADSAAASETFVMDDSG